MTRSPILKALSSIRKSGAKTLLMGGQACVFYGAAEFSRNVDLLILADPENLARLQSALRDLNAETIAVPPFEAEHLLRGHSVHFRCAREDVARLPIDVMSSLRGVAGFAKLWVRRTTIDAEEERIDLLAVEDLVRAKKTQRDKDWPMIHRLVEENYFRNAQNPNTSRIEFWLGELRTPELLRQVASEYPEHARPIAVRRPAVHLAINGGLDAVSRALVEEEREERLRDYEYWRPLKRELEEFRRAKRG